MKTEFPKELRLPSVEQRRQILAQAGLVLAEARQLAQRLDHSDSWQVWQTESNPGKLPRAQLQAIKHFGI